MFKKVTRYYPINLDVRDKVCLVVGAGAVGERKAKGLLECQAKVKVVSLCATEAIHKLALRNQLILDLRPYNSSDARGKFLIFGATNNEKLNREIYQEAITLGVLCNIADNPKASTFVLPSVVRQKDLVIAISTSNRCPAVARWLRQRLEKEFGTDYGDLLDFMGTIRQKLTASGNKPETTREILTELLNRGILEIIRGKSTSELNELLVQVLGEQVYTDQWNWLEQFFDTSTENI